MLNNDWKVRAIERRFENKALKKRIKELIISRNIWHDKAMKYKQEKEAMQKKLDAIKKKINQITEL